MAGPREGAGHTVQSEPFSRTLTFQVPMNVHTTLESAFKARALSVTKLPAEAETAAQKPHYLPGGFSPGSPGGERGQQLSFCRCLSCLPPPASGAGRGRRGGARGAVEGWGCKAPCSLLHPEHIKAPNPLSPKLRSCLSRPPEACPSGILFLSGLGSGMRGGKRPLKYLGSRSSCSDLAEHTALPSPVPP